MNYVPTPPPPTPWPTVTETATNLANTGSQLEAIAWGIAGAIALITFGSWVLSATRR